MSKKENISRFSADEMKKQFMGGADKTDWQKVQAMSQSDIECLADEEDGRLLDTFEKFAICK